MEVAGTTKKSSTFGKTPSSTRPPLWAQLAYGDLIPAALRLSPEPIQRAQNVASQASNVVIQRKPKIDLLTTAEETLVESKITGSARQDALDELVKTVYFTTPSQPPVNLGAITYDSTYTGYGLAEQDRRDPKTNNTVDIKIGPAAYADISILVSTLQHELIHAEQHTLPSVKG